MVSGNGGTHPLLRRDADDLAAVIGRAGIDSVSVEEARRAIELVSKFALVIPVRELQSVSYETERDELTPAKVVATSADGEEYTRDFSDVDLSAETLWAEGIACLSASRSMQDMDRKTKLEWSYAALRNSEVNRFKDSQSNNVHTSNASGWL